MTNPDNPSQAPIKVLNPGSDPRSAPREPVITESSRKQRRLERDSLAESHHHDELSVELQSADLGACHPPLDESIFTPASTALAPLFDPSVPQVVYKPEVYLSPNEEKSWYTYYHSPTNNVISLLHAIAIKTGRLMSLPRHLFARNQNPSSQADFHLPEESYRDPDNPGTRMRVEPLASSSNDFADVGGEIDQEKWKKRREEIQHPDVEASAVWLIQQWRDGRFGKFVLDEVTAEALMERQEEEKMMALGGLNRGKKIEKGIRREKSLARAVGMKRLTVPTLA